MYDNRRKEPSDFSSCCGLRFRLDETNSLCRHGDDGMKYFGIDLAGSVKRPTGVCVIDSRLSARCGVTYSDAEILAKVTESKATIVAIDAPLALPKGRHCLE